MSQSSSARRDGKRAYCKGDDPELECPYRGSHLRSCWIEGFYEEEKLEEDMNQQRQLAQSGRWW